METATATIATEQAAPAQPFDAKAFLQQNIPIEERHILKVTHVVGSFFRVNIFRPLQIGMDARGDMTLAQQGKVIWSRFLHCAVENVGGKVGPVVTESPRQ